MRRIHVHDPLFWGMVALTLLIGAAHVFVWGTPRTLAPGTYAVIVAICNTGYMLAMTSAAFLAIGRHQVLGDSTSYWIGVAFASYAAGTVFRILNWLDLPHLAGVIGQLPSTRAYIGNFAGMVFAACLVAMALTPAPAVQEGKPRSKNAVAAWPAGVVLGIVLMVAFERHLPVLVSATGQYTPFLTVWHWLNVMLFFSGAVVATSRYRLNRDPLLAYMAFAQLAFALITVGNVAGGSRYSILSAADRLITLGVYLVILFGLLSDYVHLLRREREKTREVEARSAEITKLNQELEERVRQRTAQLEAVNKELEAFSHSVSHDLRAPLRVMDGFSEALQAGSAGLDEKARHYVNRIRAASERMRQLIDSLLRLSRFTRAELQMQSVDVSALARSVVEELRGSQPDRNVEVRIEPFVEAIGDPHLLEAAMQNLLGNAWKYTSRRDHAIIEFGKLNNRSNPVFFVRDNGAGFDMQVAENLFGAFQRFHSEAEFQGTGIGLATVQRIINRHHGRIWAEAKPNQGATFFFELGTN